jgi:hypothetical protein
MDRNERRELPFGFCRATVVFMPIFDIILLVLGFVLLVLAGLGIPSPSRFNFLSFGLAAWILVVLIDKASGFHG